RRRATCSRARPPGRAPSRRPRRPSPRSRPTPRVVAMPDIRVGGAVGHPYGDADGTRAPANGSVRYYRHHALAAGGVAAGPGSVRVPVRNSVADWATLDPGEWTAEIYLEGPGSTGT